MLSLLWFLAWAASWSKVSYNNYTAIESLPLAGDTAIERAGLGSLYLPIKMPLLYIKNGCQTFMKNARNNTSYCNFSCLLIIKITTYRSAGFPRFALLIYCWKQKASFWQPFDNAAPEFEEVWRNKTSVRWRRAIRRAGEESKARRSETAGEMRDG